MNKETLRLCDASKVKLEDLNPQQLLDFLSVELLAKDWSFWDFGGKGKCVAGVAVGFGIILFRFHLESRMFSGVVFELSISFLLVMLCHFRMVCSEKQDQEPVEGLYRLNEFQEALGMESRGCLV